MIFSTYRVIVKRKNIKHKEPKLQEAKRERKVLSRK
jgi:hypothetical protein